MAYGTNPIQANYRFPPELKQNLAAYCAINHLEETTFVIQAVSNALREQGLQPDRFLEIVNGVFDYPVEPRKRHGTRR